MGYEDRCFTGHRGDPDLWERNLEILRLRLVERVDYAEIARATGITRSRVDQILHSIFGIDRAGRGTTLQVPVDAVPDFRRALLELLADRIEALGTAMTKGRGLELALVDFDRARSLVKEVGIIAREPEVPVEVWVGRTRRSEVLRALRCHLCLARDLADTHDRAQRRRAEASVAAMEKLLKAMP